MVVVETKDIFTLNSLKKLQKLHTSLQDNIPHLNDITSLINARNTRGEGESIIVEDLFDTFPRTQEELQKIKKTALNNKMYENLLFNTALNFTTIILEPSAYEDQETGNELAGFGEDIVEENIEFLSQNCKRI
ncbi:exporter of the RND superfamily protein-like protein [hydrothermal vent metagenome]|uniref:Exporter of the RND superfamily protein-like protein n=1 Tax=hydrothermal vent metagenome TaxID=652676 RepID=A0A1W1BG92_9ZZZZ